MANSSALKPNVLAVDDYPANITALEAVLGDDFNVLVANSGTEAISIVEKRTDIHVILMDVQMPDMDGYETALKIKGIKHAENIPIIFITAIYKEDPFVKKGYEHGAVDYFGKPFDPEILKMKLHVYSAYSKKTELLADRERRLVETEEVLQVGRKLSSVLESLPVGVLISDREGRICQTNNLVSEICKGLKSNDTDFYGEALGWWDHEGQMIKDKSGPLFRAIKHGETSHNQVIPIQRPDGTTKLFLGSASPLLGLDGHIVGAVVIIQDITESKKISHALENQITNLISAGFGIENTVAHAKH